MTAHRYDDLRAQVRAFLDAEIAAGTIAPTADSWLTGWDTEFTRRLAERGWVGMTIPREYGGHGRGHLERFAVTEELLAVGAPVAAHWIADRQIAPSLLKFGTEAQKRALLPGIASGTVFFGIGMSEPDAGSDLAAVRTRATRVDGGWELTGTKVWTSGAHRAHYFIALARTHPREDGRRHNGLSQFIVDLRGPGVTVNPIISMNGGHHFNEVVLEKALVPDERVFGEIGAGWTQVTSELAFERSGPERFLSTFPLLSAAVESDDSTVDDAALGASIARIAGLHHMSGAVAETLAREEPADLAAAVVKVLGTATEGDIADVLDLTIADDTSPLGAAVAAAADQRPGFTLRGGTNEILRGVIARGLGMR
ncbi:acyl-CoA dehydrogenase family protein [Gordonia alkaliphila]|uniref:acyl-CoA dehydrogenase family protein n=1 Tax=Gordonia alkaliphila TaxID=1053547 RepID=UPI001FF3EA9F|nr:acyl-CoA dehydrogenase family protein [Gordonia alkaliphila]MCK0438892.1 acyl-CoA dehydrogenase family protein [Gordonia alkaliphila]